MFTPDRTLLLKAYICIAAIGLPIDRLLARGARQKYDRGRYEKIWDQDKKQKKRKKKKKKKRSDAATIFSILNDYKEVVGVGFLCFFFGYVVSSSDTQAPFPEEAVYIIDKDPARIKSKMTQKAFDKTVARAWAAKPAFTAKEKNDASDFVGYDGMAEKLVEEVAKFEKCKRENNWKKIWSDHYDWWVFAIPYISSGHSTEYVVYKKDVEALKEYVYDGKNAIYKGWTYVRLQRRAAELLLESMGWWDSDQQKITGRCKKLHTDVRRGKMMHALLLWNKDLYEVANALTLELESEGYRLGKEYQPYITRKRA